MIPKEKAKELVEKFEPFADYTECDAFTQRENMLKNSKQCALIAVDVILSSRPTYPYPDDVGLKMQGICTIIGYPFKYWTEVKQEIEKLEIEKL